MQVSEGETIDPSLWAIVDGVLRSSTGENSKLVRQLLLRFRRLMANRPWVLPCLSADSISLR